MYSPKIAKDLIPILYVKAKNNKKPMTKIVDTILRAYLFDKHEKDTSNNSA